MSKRIQPHWLCPESSEKTKLKLYNSLTREKVRKDILKKTQEDTLPRHVIKNSIGSIWQPV